MRSPPLTPNRGLKPSFPRYWSNSYSDFGALRANGTITATAPADNSTLDPYWSRRARQAYWAALSYTDDNIGAVVAAAKAAGLYKDAIVLLWGDHGYATTRNAVLPLCMDPDPCECECGVPCATSGVQVVLKPMCCDPNDHFRTYPGTSSARMTNGARCRTSSSRSESR